MSSYTGELKTNVILDFIKGLIISMLTSFTLIILLAFSLKWFSLSENKIVPINLVIKLVSVILGACVAVKGNQKGLIKGAIYGITYIIVAFVCFSTLAKSFSVDLSFVLDLIFSAAAGGIVGIIKVNRK